MILMECFDLGFATTQTMLWNVRGIEQDHADNHPVLQP